MSNSKKSGGALGKGYYIALIACAAAIGLTGYLYYQNNTGAKKQLESPTEAVMATQAGQEDVQVAATQPQTDPSQPVTQPTEKPILKTGWPLEGKTVASYAMDALSYNATTRDWRVHNGIDIGAETGTPVLAAADGVVYTVCNDDLYGTTVVIRHEGGYVTQYSSLAEEVSVQAGDAVKLGQAIGTVGETAMLETAVGEHVHFCVTYLDEMMDPNEFLSMN